MKFQFAILTAALAAVSMGQTLEQAYNRDTGDPFKLKNVATKTIVKGPIVKQQTVLTFDNPVQKLTEASVWFRLDWAAVLSGFGYWFKDEFVPGILMDKRKAWFIYTAITSRNEDPGIMVQTSPSSYHAQIFPVAIGHDLRIELSSLGFLRSQDFALSTPEPNFEGDAKFEHQVTSDHPEQLLTTWTNGRSHTTVDLPKQEGLDLQIHSERHKDGYTYVAGMLRTNEPDAKLNVKGIHRIMWTRPEVGDTDGSVKYFIGRRKGSGTLSIESKSPQSGIKQVVSKPIRASERSPDVSKLWAHQRLVQDEWRSTSDVLKFSLAYQIPSTQTALLAVPQEQMKLFKEKEAEFQRKQREEARKQRAWQKQRSLNNRVSGGGDPEIRIELPNATKVTAILPDGRSVELRKMSGGYWYGNFDIPADAPEGVYKVRLDISNKGGVNELREIEYDVDRTAPKGVIRTEDKFYVIDSEPGLFKAIAVFGDGSEDRFIETESGKYKLPIDSRRLVKVVLIDKGHNLAEIEWSH